MSLSNMYVQMTFATCYINLVMSESGLLNQVASKLYHSSHTGDGNHINSYRFHAVTWTPNTPFIKL